MSASTIVLHWIKYIFTEIPERKSEVGGWVNSQNTGGWDNCLGTGLCKASCCGCQKWTLNTNLYQLYIKVLFQHVLTTVYQPFIVFMSGTPLTQSQLG